MTYILYSRAGCSLCAKAKTVLEKAGLDFTEVSIEGDAALEELYQFEIPVLADETGRQIFKGVISESRVAALLATG
jgi:glutaredoxin-related protein